MTVIPAIIPVEKKLLTEAEYEALDNRYEIIDGQLMERGLMSARAVITRDNLYSLLVPVVRQQKSGHLFGDGMIFYMWKTTKGIKGAYIPDIAFVRKENLMKDWTIDKNYPGVPDLAIEVVSSNDEAEKLMKKIRGYLERGTEQIWVIYPELQELHQYFRDQPDNVRVYFGDAQINAEAFFPGIHIVVGDLCKLPNLD